MVLLVPGRGFVAPAALGDHPDQRTVDDASRLAPCPDDETVSPAKKILRGSRGNNARSTARKEMEYSYDRPASSRNAWTVSNSMWRFFSMMIVWVPSGSMT